MEYTGWYIKTQLNKYTGWYIKSQWNIQVGIKKHN